MQGEHVQDRQRQPDRQAGEHAAHRFTPIPICKMQLHRAALAQDGQTTQGGQESEEPAYDGVRWRAVEDPQERIGREERGKEHFHAYHPSQQEPGEPIPSVQAPESGRQNDQRARDRDEIKDIEQPGNVVTRGELGPRQEDGDHSDDDKYKGGNLSGPDFHVVFSFLLFRISSKVFIPGFG